MFGLSKERPILGDHPKAHIMKSGGFHVKSKRHSLPPALHKTEEFLLSYLIGLSKERPILGDHPKAHIHEIRRISGEIRRISKDQLPGMVKPYVISL